jgi:hypothetical protein
MGPLPTYARALEEGSDQPTTCPNRGLAYRNLMTKVKNCHEGRGLSIPGPHKP